MKIKYTDELSHSYYIGPGPGNRWREKNGQFGHDPDPNYRNTMTPGHHDVPYERLTPSYSNRLNGSGSGSYNNTYNNPNNSNTGNNQPPVNPNNSNNSNNPNTGNNQPPVNPNVNLKDIKSLAAATSTSGKEIAKAAELFAKPKQGKRLDISNMTDDDLRAILNRERMEREYNNYFNPPTVNKGAEVVKGVGNFISTSGTIALTALQAVEIIRGFTGH